MRQKEASIEFHGKLDRPESTEIALALVKKQIEWLEFVSGDEFETNDHVQLIRACRAFYSKLRPLVKKYVDGTVRP